MEKRIRKIVNVKSQKINLKLVGFILGLLSITTVQAQNHQINFTATGASTNLDSVKVENLTQCTQVTIGGDDILNLVSQLSIKDVENKTNNSLSIFPNPMVDFSNIKFEVPVSGIVSFEITDMNGNIILHSRRDLNKGYHEYVLFGLVRGVYAIHIGTQASVYVGKIISMCKTTAKPGIIYQGLANEKTDNTSYSVTNKNKAAGRLKSIIQMQYNTGDIIKLTGISGIYRTVFMIEPTEDQTVSFTFIPCTDADGNNYSVVQIGEQWWMAENLNSGTFASITTPQVSGTKFCMNINGQEDSVCPMGGLYEWDNLMQGESFCNGSGAYPNDRCDIPVQGLCPDGWHIPSHFEWNTLSANSGEHPEDFPYNMSLGVYGIEEGGNLKATCTTDWWNPNLGATNKTGFSAIPGGDTWDNTYEDFGQSTYFWTSTATDYSVYYTPWVYALNYSVSTIGRSEYVKENGFSVRCVKD